MPKITSFRQRIARSIMLFLALILAACGATNPHTPGITQTAAATPSIISPTNIQPAASATATLNPTQVILAMEFEMTKTAYSPLQTQFPECNYVHLPENTFSKSPDNKWTIAECFPLILKGENGETIKISRESFLSFLAHGDEYMELRAVPEYWSLDGESLYFSVQWNGGEGCGCFCYSDGLALFELDIASEKISPILLLDDHGWFMFAFSPDGKQLAYIDDNNREFYNRNIQRLVIRDLETGKENIKTFDEYTEIGNLVWSPDGKQLALGMAFCPDTTFPTFNLGVVKINEGLSPKIVFSMTGSELDWQAYNWHIDPWQNDNVIVLTNLDYDYVQVDLSGPQPLIVTGTPEP